MARPRKIRPEEQISEPKRYDELPKQTLRHNFTYKVTDESLLTTDMKEEGAIDEYLQSCFELGANPALPGVLIGVKENG